ncbi:MAG: cyclase [Chloroflexota bacterium]
MVRLFVRHKVSNYEGWRKVYDDFDAKRRSMGVKADAVYRSVDDTNDVTVTHDFDSADKAHALIASPELREAMGNAHVEGIPEMWVTNDA